MFKRLKNIENKIKSENKKESEPIKNEEQLAVLKDESTVANKKPKETVLLKDELDFIFKIFGSNFNNTGKKFLVKLAEDKEKIVVIKNVNFLEEIATLYDLFIYLLNDSMKIITSTETQIDFFKAITV